MMPTNPIGPASETATPVASDDAKNARRCTPTTGTPRDPACSAPSASALRLRGSHAKAAAAGRRITTAMARGL